MDDKLLSKWYMKLTPRNVDLVGDFAGSDLFIIEGDSLLLECFSNKKLDFSPGFQLLHATYLVERFLKKLRQRKCVFEIVFFAQNARLCIPADADDSLEDRYLLAREVIMRHLIAISNKSPSDFQVTCFDTFEEHSFAEHLGTLGVYLLVCHDGALVGRTEDSVSDNSSQDDDSVSVSDNESNPEPENDAEIEGKEDEEILSGNSSHPFDSQIQLRRMIHWFCVHGQNVSLINTVSFRATKVISMVIENSFDATNSSIFSDSSQLGGPATGKNQDLTQLKPTQLEPDLEKVAIFLEKIIQKLPGLTQRQYLAVVTVAVILSEDADRAIDIETGAMALILHLVLLQETKLEERTLRPSKVMLSTFLDRYLKVARVILESENWRETVNESNLPWDICDMIDGRMFFEAQKVIQSIGIQQALSSATTSSFNELASLVDYLCGTRLQRSTVVNDGKSRTSSQTRGADISTEKYYSMGCSSSHYFTTVLPFKNEVFDNHLRPVHIVVDSPSDAKCIKQSANRFREDTHWHKRRPLDSKKSILSPDELTRSQRRNQIYMNEMQKYADSLVGRVRTSGPETIVTEPAAKVQQKNAIAEGKPRSKFQGTPKDTSKKPSVREQAAMTIKQNAMEEDMKMVKRWDFKLREFERCLDPVSRFIIVEEYCHNLPRNCRPIMEPDVLTYMLETLRQAIAANRKGQERIKDITFLEHAWGVITRLMRIKQGVSMSISKYVENYCRTLGLPSVLLPVQKQNDQSLSFKPLVQPTQAKPIPSLHEVEFQLLNGGPFMERSIDSSPDVRTPDFDPDSWQREVLDQIDAKQSVFVVAPTSAGKTFISFYAMRQVLKEDNTGVLVYIAPTKALVNQIAAEIQTKFRKEYPLKSTTKSIWAIHTRDHRINNPASCQILITVPHILQIMLLSPSKANLWTPRLKRIIFDEIHCIGQAEDGVIWEQLLLLSPCPVIALSATVGNPEEFHAWLKYTQKANDHELKMIRHQHRYSDLRKYLYCPDDSFEFKGLPKACLLSRLGLDEAPGMKFLHPVLSLVDRSRGIPEDLSLEPRDCLSLWQVLHDLQTDEFPIALSLDPHILFAGAIIRKIDVIEWQKSLLQVLGNWMKDRRSPFEKVLEHLSLKFQDLPFDPNGDKSVSTQPSQTRQLLRPKNELFDTTLPLICSLHSQGALPALFFNYDRSMCEDICHDLLCKLQEAEKIWESESPKWKAQLDKWEEWQKAKGHEKKRVVIKSPKKKGARDDETNDTISRAEQLRESASAETDSMETFDPEKPLEKFSLADPRKLTSIEFSNFARELRSREISEWLIHALERGIGVHHAGMNRKYRQICEILFRKGFLRVVIATGTLALGINMPCKTVVFSGDSLFLTALNFRQASGRAGRRGLDILGNVVFQHVPTQKVHRLISSRLPDLNGHFPITTSLVLRLFILLHGSKKAPSAVKSISSILSSPQICLGGPEMKQTVLHFLRFSIDYLRRNSLLDEIGSPLDFAGCISHLYYTENSSFAFHALLHSGYFAKLCRHIIKKPKATLRQLMLVMSHIFGRFHLRRSTLESYSGAEKRSSSIVVLPPMPKMAAKVVKKHNRHVLDIYTGYVSTYIDQHVKTRDCCLPLSGWKVEGEKSSAELGVIGKKVILPAPRITSPFYALSGQHDVWESVSDLCEMVRGDVWLEESAIPYVPVTSEVMPLNAYLYDFFKHGNVQQLEISNGIRRNDIWYRLNDFSMILSTLITSLDIFLDPSTSKDPDLLDVTGRGVLQEIEIDDRLAGEEDDTAGTAPNAKCGGPQKDAKGKTAVTRNVNHRLQHEVLDSWEDEDIEGTGESFANGKSSHSHEETEAEIDPNHNQSKNQTEAQSRKSLMLVLKAFHALKTEFDEKFKKMWA